MVSLPETIASAPSALVRKLAATLLDREKAIALASASALLAVEEIPERRYVVEADGTIHDDAPRMPRDVPERSRSADGKSKRATA